MFPLIRWDSINDISQGLFITFPQIRRGERGLKVKNFSDKGPLFHDKGAMMPLGLIGREYPKMTKAFIADKGGGQKLLAHNLHATLAGATHKGCLHREDGGRHSKGGCVDLAL